MKADWRLIILLILAAVFMVSAIQQHSSQPLYIEDNFIAFDTAKVFDLPALEDECFEPSPLDKMPPF
jgi:hypothetical protein